MTLIRTGLLNSLAMAVRLLCMMALNKILAVMVGPSGYSFIGQLQNTVTTLTAIASAGVGTGVTKYTAQYHDEPDCQHKLWKTATFMGVFFSLITAILIIIFSEELAFILFKNQAYSNIFFWVASCLILYVFNTFLLSVINGLKEFGLFVAANVANSLIALALTGGLSWVYGLYGALIGLAVSQSIVCVATVIMIIKRSWCHWRNFFGLPNRQMAINLSHFTLMAIATSVFGPLTQILIRNILVDHINIEASGYFEAMTRISNLYLAVISSTLTVYLIPVLSSLNKIEDQIREIKKILMVVIPLTVFMALLVYIFRILIIKILFSNDFLIMEVLFGWQLVGDIFRSICWVFSFYLLSQSSTLKFILAETLSCFFNYSASIITIKYFGLVGASIAYTLNSIFSTCILILLILPMVYKRPSH